MSKYPGAAAAGAPPTPRASSPRRGRARSASPFPASDTRRSRRRRVSRPVRRRPSARQRGRQTPPKQQDCDTCSHEHHSLGSGAARSPMTPLGLSGSQQTRAATCMAAKRISVGVQSPPYQCVQPRHDGGEGVGPEVAGHVHEAEDHAEVAAAHVHRDGVGARRGEEEDEQADAEHDRRQRRVGDDVGDGVEGEAPTRLADGQALAGDAAAAGAGQQIVGQQAADECRRRRRPTAAGWRAGWPAPCRRDGPPGGRSASH